MPTNRKTKKQYRNTSAEEGMEPHAVGGAVGAALGTAAGTIAAGAASGSVLGTAAGPIGLVVGAAIGGAVGGLAGKEIAEAVNPTEEDEFWRTNYASRDYVRAGSDYDTTYRPAYRYGITAYSRYEGRAFEDIEPELSKSWDSARETSILPWEEARFAARDAYDRIGETRRQTNKDL